VNAIQRTRAILAKQRNPVSPPPEVTLTIGVADKRTIAPQTLPRKRNGFVSTNIGCNFQSVSLKIGKCSETKIASRLLG
jgi:hypothetical protein